MVWVTMLNFSEFAMSMVTSTLAYSFHKAELSHFGMGMVMDKLVADLEGELNSKVELLLNS